MTNPITITIRTPAIIKLIENLTVLQNELHCHPVEAPWTFEDCAHMALNRGLDVRLQELEAFKADRSKPS